MIAFEPHPANYDRMVGNVALNDFSNVLTRNIGVGRGPGTLQLAAPSGGWLPGRQRERRHQGRIGTSGSMTKFHRPDELDRSQISEPRDPSPTSSRSTSRA